MLDDGKLVEREEEILVQVSNYYKHLFTSSAGNRMEELLLQIVPAKVTARMNSNLLRPFTEEEVKAGLDAIGDLKAPGAGGMSSLFYKKHCTLLVRMSLEKSYNS